MVLGTSGMYVHGRAQNFCHNSRPVRAGPAKKRIKLSRVEARQTRQVEA